MEVAKGLEKKYNTAMKKRVVLSALLAAGLLFWLFQAKNETKLQEQASAQQEVKGVRIATPIEPVEQTASLVIKQDAVDFFSMANSAYAVDVETGNILYQKNAFSPWSPASLTKIMTAQVVLSLVSEDLPVTIADDDLLVPNPKMGLRSGEVISVENLLKGMLISSANDSALALARAIGGTHDQFVYYMNVYAERLGLKTTHFKNPVGFDDPGQFISAYDVATLAKEFLKNETLSKIVNTQSTTVKSMNGAETHELISTNRLLSHQNIFGIKTGFTDEARGNLLLLGEHPSGRRFLVVVLGSEQREQDSLLLVDWVNNSYEIQK